MRLVALQAQAVIQVDRVLLELGVVAQVAAPGRLVARASGPGQGQGQATGQPGGKGARSRLRDRLGRYHQFAGTGLGIGLDSFLG